MTQPPAEPPPEEGWQPPGPPPPQQPPTQPPQQPPTQPQQPWQQPQQQPWIPPRPPPSQGQGHNPYGGDTSSYYRPIDSGGMSASVKVVLGVLIGVFGGFFLWFVAAIAFSASSNDSGNGFLFFAAVAPLVVPLPLLLWKATRPWALGLLMGTAVASIGMSSLCSALISGFEGGA